MTQIKYSYCVDEHNNLVHINSLTDSTRHDRKFFCLQCGQEMVANLGTKKVWHFSHKAGTTCDGESYLHKLAKRRIRESFLAAEHFPIIFTMDVPCMERKTCPCFVDSYCLKHDFKNEFDLKKWKGEVIFDNCQEEVKEGDFRPDLLLSCSTKPNRHPVFIEIYKTHKSEESKVTSGYKIIETTEIKSEEDIDDIINRGFVEGENCQTFGFKPQIPQIRADNIPIDRFILFKNGTAKIFRALDYVIYCDKISQKYDPQSIIELNIRGMNIDIWGNDGSLNYHQKCLLYLVKKGMVIRNCILCKFNVYNEYYSHFICKLYKILDMESPVPRQTTANKCPRFELNPELMKYPLSELEKEISEVGSDILSSN